MFETTLSQVYVFEFPELIDEEFIRFVIRDVGTINGYINAVLTFESPLQAMRAIHVFNNTTFDDHSMGIIRNDPLTMDLIKRRENILIITGLEDSIHAYQLHKTFSRFGQFIQSYITSDLNRIGYVQFYRAEDAENAMRNYDSGFANGSEIKIEKFTPQTTDAIAYLSCI